MKMPHRLTAIAAALVLATTPADANDLNWAKTGLNKTSAEQDAAKIVFAEE